MNLRHHIGALLGVTLSTCCWAEEPALELKTNQDRANYRAGYQAGAQLKQEAVGLSQEALLKGVADSLAGAAPAVAEKAMDHSMMGHQHGMAEHVHSGKIVMSQQDIAQGRLFLAENAKKEGVIKLANGLQYQVLKTGTGKTPKATDTVIVKYEGSLPNGQPIGKSTHEGKPGPSRYIANRLIPGLREALIRMKEGDHWRVFVPPELSFPRGSSALEQRVVIYDLELLSVEPSS